MNETQLTTRNVYFISGHRDITDEEFEHFYKPVITNCFNMYRTGDVKFVVGDYHGVDIKAQELLSELLRRERHSDVEVSVYHMGERPMNLASSKFKLVGGFNDDISRDSAMTDISSSDIAWVREGKAGSGTHQNIIRRASQT